jgi:hypothetical protein
MSKYFRCFNTGARDKIAEGDLDTWDDPSGFINHSTYSVLKLMSLPRHQRSNFLWSLGSFKSVRPL